MKKVEKNKENYSFVKQVKNTPFTVIELENENKFVLTVGKQIASSQEFTNIEEAEEYVSKWDWDLVISVVLTMIKNSEKL